MEALDDISAEELLATKPVTMEVKEALIKRFTPLCWKMAYRMRNYYNAKLYGDDEDWFQEATIILLAAMDEWDASKGAKFITYATNWIWFKLRNVQANKASLIRITAYKAARDSEAVQALTPSPFMIDEDGRQYDPPCKIGKPAFDDDDKTALKIRMQWLEERERLVLQRRVVDNVGLRDVGREMGMCYETARQVEIKALAKLREWLSDAVLA